MLIFMPDALVMFVPDFGILLKHLLCYISIITENGSLDDWIGKRCQNEMIQKASYIYFLCETLGNIKIPIGCNRRVLTL